MHATKPAPSMLHWNVPASFDENENDADGDVDGFGGNVFIVVSGAVASMSQLNDAGVESVLPAASIALTWNECEPSPSGPNVSPLVHVMNAPLSIEHSNVAVRSADENVNDGVGSLDGLDGVVSIVVSGDMVSIVQEYESVSELPAASDALTSNV